MAGAQGARPQHGGNLEWAAMIAGCDPAALLDFSASISPQGPPNSIVRMLQQQLETLLVAYPDPSYQQLRRVLAQHHGVEADWILPGNGAAELLTWAARDLAACAQVYVVEPGFGDYGRSLQAVQARITPLRLNVDVLFNDVLFDTGLKQIPWPRLTPLDGLLLNNPHNPTGVLFETQSLRSHLEQGSLVVVDEAFMDFLPPERQQSLVGWVQDFPNLVILRSLTKFYSLAGLRLGYALLHPDRARRWQQWRDPWPVNRLAAIAAEVGLEDHAFQRQTWDWLEQTKPRLLAALQALPGLDVYPGAANFLLVRSQQSVIQLQTQLLKKYQILIRDCLSFPTLGDRFFRIAVRRPEENQRLVGAIANVLSDFDDDNFQSTDSKSTDSKSTDSKSTDSQKNSNPEGVS